MTHTTPLLYQKKKYKNNNNKSTPALNKANKNRPDSIRQTPAILPSIKHKSTAPLIGYNLTRFLLHWAPYTDPLYQKRPSLTCDSDEKELWKAGAGDCIVADYWSVKPRIVMIYIQRGGSSLPDPHLSCLLMLILLPK